MAMAEQFRFEATNSSFGQASYMPMLPMVLSMGNHTVTTSGLIDTGSSVNVMPYDVGVQLGAVWEDLNTPIKLTGNLASHESRGLIITAQVHSWKPVRLAFAWSRSNDIPLILGQVNSL